MVAKRSRKPCRGQTREFDSLTLLNAPLAQWPEQPALTRRVEGSSPSRRTAGVVEWFHTRVMIWRRRSNRTPATFR